MARGAIYGCCCGFTSRACRSGGVSSRVGRFVPARLYHVCFSAVPRLFAVSFVCVIHTHLLSQALVQGPIQIARPRYPENVLFGIGLGAAPTQDVWPYSQSRFSAFGQSLQWRDLQPDDLGARDRIRSIQKYDYTSLTFKMAFSHLLMASCSGCVVKASRATAYDPSPNSARNVNGAAVSIDARLVYVSPCVYFSTGPKLRLTLNWINFDNRSRRADSRGYLLSLQSRQLPDVAAAAFQTLETHKRDMTKRASGRLPCFQGSGREEIWGGRRVRAVLLRGTRAHLSLAQFFFPPFEHYPGSFSNTLGRPQACTSGGKCGFSVVETRWRGSHFKLVLFAGCTRKCQMSSDPRHISTYRNGRTRCCHLCSSLSSCSCGSYNVPTSTY